MGAAEKADSAAAHLKQMRGQFDAGPNIVDSHQVKSTAAGKLQEIAIEQNNSDASRIEPFGDRSIAALSIVNVLYRRKEDATHTTVDVLSAQILRMRSRIDRIVRVSPEHLGVQR